MKNITLKLLLLFLSLFNDLFYTGAYFGRGYDLNGPRRYELSIDWVAWDFLVAGAIVWVAHGFWHGVCIAVALIFIGMFLKLLAEEVLHYWYGIER